MEQESTSFMEPVMLKGDGKVVSEQVPNGLHLRQENGKPGSLARVYSRKRARDATSEGLSKKVKRGKVGTQEERVNGLLGKTADILLVLAGLAQMRGGRPPSDVERQLAADAQSNLGSLVSRVVPSSLLSKHSLEGMVASLGLVKRPDGRLEPAPRLQEAEKAGEDSDSDDSSGSVSGKDDGSQIQSGMLTSPSGLSLDDEADIHLKQADEFEEFEDEQSQVMRHRELAKLVQQIKSEGYVPLPAADVNNAYMITLVPCEVCQVLAKDATTVVVCDGCEKVYHCKCLPQLHIRELPKGDWCCPRCNGVKPKYGPVTPKTAGTPNKMPVRKPDYKQTLVQPLGGLSNGPSESPNSSKSVAAAGSVVSDRTEAPKAQQTKPGEAAAAAPTQVTLHVDWVGEPLKVVNRRAYYTSCTVGGWTYKLQDCALFRPETPDTAPYIARLQQLWEDLENGAKWVRVHWLYYPSDMPAAIAGPPDTVEADEVFETNHSDNNLIGSIQGPCQVLIARKYQEEKERRGKLVSGAGELPPVFLCKWLYDAPLGKFRKAEGT